MKKHHPRLPPKCALALGAWLSICVFCSVSLGGTAELNNVRGLWDLENNRNFQHLHGFTYGIPLGSERYDRLARF